MRHSGYAGIGFVFTADDPFTCVDLDCLDAEALAIVAELDSYTEMSPSGRGAHVIAQGVKPADGCKRGAVEMYDRGRFLTITGHLTEGAPAAIQERQPELDAVHARIFPPTPRALPRPPQGCSSADDADVLRKMFGSKNGAEIRRLWDGDWGGYPSQSEADAALCAHLRYWCNGDVAQVERLFPRSGLYRPKWERPDYRRQTFQMVGLL
jgi:primase-polymerase (primpol)-like protein